MSEHTPATTRDVSRPDSRRFNATVVVVGLVLLVGYLYFDGKKSREAAEARLTEQLSQNAELQKSMANLQEVVSDLKTSKLYQDQEQAVARDTSLAALQIAQSAEKRIAELRRAVEVWETNRTQVLANEAGQKLASDWKLVERASRVLSTDLPTSDAVDLLSNRLDNLMQPVRRAVEQQDTAFVPSKDLRDRVDEIDTATTAQLEQIQRATRDLAALVTDAGKLAASETMTLQTALDGLQTHRDEERRKIEEAALVDVRREGDERLAKEKAEAQRKLDLAKAEATKLAGELAASRIVQEAQAEKRRQDESMQAKQAAEAKAAREAEFEKALPDIKHYLSALVDPGTTYRKDPAKEGPVSYAILQERNAFREGRVGLEGLMYVASIQNDRNQGPIPMFIGSEDGFRRTNTPELRKAHELLLKHGKQMLEKGLLAP